MITTHIIVAGAARAARWYSAVLGAEEKSRITLPDGRLIHLELWFGPSVVMVADEFPEHGALSPAATGTSAVLYLQTGDVDAVWARALAGGARVLRPLTETFWGEREGQITDPFGHRWGLSQHVRDVPLEEMSRAAAGVFGGSSPGPDAGGHQGAARVLPVARHVRSSGPEGFLWRHERLSRTPTGTARITVMTTPITGDRDIDALKVAASWPGADRATLVNLATRLAAARADVDGSRYFQQLAEASPGQPLPLALAGFFQARLGEDVDAALARLDQAAAADVGLPQYFRGLALTALPPDPRRAAQAVEDLEFVLAVRDQFPPALLRAAHRGLAIAYAALGKDDLAAEALRRSGLGAVPADSQLLFTSYWVTAEDGFRFTPPAIFEPEPGIRVAQGYDFCDFAFITTSKGVVAIDAGTTTERVQAALDDLGITSAAISHLIFTHAHWDHVGGAAALLGPATQVIAQAGFPAELDRQRGNTLPFGYFTGHGTSTRQPIIPGRLISAPTVLRIGGTEFVLYPTPGGETPDALMVHLPASGLLFTGDVMMPYLGAPFFAEGSPGGLLETLRFIGQLQPRALIQGHAPLTELFTVDAVAGLEAALTHLYRHVLDGIRGRLTLPAILEASHIPDVLRDHPTAVGPYLAIRETFAARLYHQRTGYWQPDGRGLEPVTDAARAAALDLLAHGSEQPFITAAATLIGQGDPALALEVINPGLLAHPGSTALAGLRHTALHRLLERHQQSNPFKFLIYAELAGTEIAPAQ